MAKGEPFRNPSQDSHGSLMMFIRACDDFVSQTVVNQLPEYRFARGPVVCAKDCVGIKSDPHAVILGMCASLVQVIV